MIDNQAVQEMVRRVKDEIARSPRESILTFDEVPIQDMCGPATAFSRRDMKDAAEKLMMTYRLVPERNIESDKPGMKGKVITFFKKVARKSMRFYIEPVCEQQSELNHLYASGFRQFTLAFTELEPNRTKVSENAKRLAKLEAKIKER